MKAYSGIDPFPLMLMHFEVSASDNFESIVAKIEITYDEQIHHLPLCFQLYLRITFFFVERFHIFLPDIFKSVHLSYLTFFNIPKNLL